MEKLDVSQKTKTFTYLLPMLGTTLVGNRQNVVNVFLGDNDYPELTNHIFVLYRFQGNSDFLAFEDKLEKESLFVKSYDPDRKHVMKVFRVPNGFQEDYDTFKKSQYSKLSRDLKTRIMAFHNLPPEHPAVDVLFKREAAFLRLEASLNNHPGISPVYIDRKQEASGLLDMSREVYNSKYKQIDALVSARGEFLEEGED